METQTQSNRPYAVVVGIDFDASGDHALEEAVRLAASRPGVAIHVVHVINGTPARDAAGLDHAAGVLESVPNKLRTHLTQQLARMPGAAGMTIMVHVRLGAPATAIHQLAVDLDASLIIVGTHARRGVKRIALGSVAEDLVRNAHCPVLVARPVDFSGLERTAAAEPVCPECAKTRAATGNPGAWCEYHSRPQVRPHTYGYSETFPVGGHDPGIVAG